MAHLTDLDHTAPADSLKSGAQVLNTWRTRIDALNDVLGDITAVEATQIEAIGTTTISAAQWGYLGACVAGGGQLLAALTASESTQLEAIGSTTISAAQWGYLGGCSAGGGQLLAALATGESTQLENIGSTTISAAQWVYLGALDQSLITSDSPTFANITISGLTSGRVTFATTSGLLTDDSDFLFATDTLTVTKIGAFQAVGAIDFNSQNMTNVDIDSGTINGITDLAIADGGTGSSTAANARTALGLAIGSNVLAYDAGLSNLAGISMAADKFYYTSADNTHVAGTITAFGRSIIDDADEATFKGTVNLEIGTDIQAYDAGLTDIAGLAVTNGNFIVGDGSNWVAESGATARTSLGLGSIATQAANSVDIDGGAIDGTIIGANSAVALTCTTFTSTGIDDNADATAITISSAEVVSVGAAKLTIGATTPTATQWGYLGALTTDPVGGDGTAGRIWRSIGIAIDNGTDDQTLKCTVTLNWNGDTIAETDNIVKNDTTGDFHLNSTGKVLTIKASGLTGNCIYAMCFIVRNQTTTDLNIIAYASASDIVMQLFNTATGASQDITALVNTDKISIDILYITDA